MRRPSDWKNPYPPEIRQIRKMRSDCCYTPFGGELPDDAYEVVENWAHNIYEDSADAILEALKKTGKHIKEGEAYCCPCQVCNNGEDCIATEDGVIVFIPEKKALKKEELSKIDYQLTPLGKAMAKLQAAILWK